MSDDKSHIPEELGHEPIAVSARGVAIAIAILFAVIVASLSLMIGFRAFLSLTRQNKPTVGSAGTPIAPPPGVPEVDANQPNDLRRLRSRETQMLSEYSWVDREAGVARIPVLRAMEIMSQKATPRTEQPNDNRDGQ